MPIPIQYHTQVEIFKDETMEGLQGQINKFLAEKKVAITGMSIDHSGYSYSHGGVSHVKTVLVAAIWYSVGKVFAPR